jgi:ABC-type transport system involved in multi-copper enzyme maturation permease subunit
MGAFVVLLVANEFTWRTARQNVIDGLSKEAWFAGKLLLVPVLALVVLLVLMTSGAVIASLGTDPPRTEPLLRGADMRQIAAYFLSLIGFGSFAFLVATSVRAAGPALGAFFAYFFIAETLIRAFLSELTGRANRFAQYLPGVIFNELLDRRLWDPEYAARRAEVLSRSLRPPTVSPLELETIIGFTVAYIGAFVALSWYLHRKRDL